MQQFAGNKAHKCTEYNIFIYLLMIYDCFLNFHAILVLEGFFSQNLVA